ncbi:DNA polymerase epsilon subunit 3-like [Onthophagus taurus]|uniref:DNA polymerase epsilon subunit 3-like n=1 Tax=Onthophagus taurus TaxID=166361 RepID=UPI000C1FEE28|nr:DNA polymerase epsilon subunit D-like [Onthophagus taurus]
MGDISNEIKGRKLPELLNFKLPKSAVRSIIVKSLPESVHLSEDLVNSVSWAASMFIFYVTTLSRDADHQKETINAERVFDALETAGYQEFIEELKSNLDAYKNGKCELNEDEVSEE